MSTLVPPLFAGLVDDASLLPPSPTSLPDAIAKHAEHRAGWYAGLLGPLLVPASLIAAALPAQDLPVALLGDVPISALPIAVEKLRAAGAVVFHLEAAVARRGEDPQPGLAALRTLAGQDKDLQVYAEIPLSWGLLTALDAVAEARGDRVRMSPKFRVGGLAGELFPTPVELAAVICACRDRELPFRLAAGLRHAIRHTDPETGFTHHGFLNVLTGSVLATEGAEVAEVAEALAATHPLPLVEPARRRRDDPRPLFVGFGATNVVEPLTELIRLGLINGGFGVSLFGVENLPYGVFSAPDSGRRIGVRLGSGVVDLTPLGGPLAAATLNPLLAAGPPEWTAARRRVTELVAEGPPVIPLDEVRLHLPFEVADYTDFYSSEQHALNAGRILRPDSPGLPPSWRRLPIGYHGRSATVVISGTPIARPSGQLADGVFGPSQRLDIEAEVGFVVGVPGRRLRTADFARHVFGVVLLNDWSARDIQAYEYRPLGPFLGKSFATSISPWVVPLDVLAPIEPPVQDPAPHDYLLPPGPGFDLRLAIDWNDTRVATPPFAGMYWTAAQQLAHLTSNGATVRTGDLYASGTVSGPARDEAGSFLELTWNGTEPIKLADGSDRGFLLDGDRVTISATAAGAAGVEIGLGEVTGTIVATA